MVNVIFDYGHGWNKATRSGDPGASGAYSHEADVVYKWGKMVKAHLENNFNVKVFEVRPSATNFVTLRGRTTKANQIHERNKTALFVSFHNNAFNKKANGYETFTFSSSNVEANRIRNIVHNKMIPVLRKYKIFDRGKKHGNLHVLRETRMPSMLIELLFIDNPREEKLLNDAKFLDESAYVTAMGIGEAVRAKRKTAVKPVTPPKETTKPKQVDPNPTPRFQGAIDWGKETKVSDGSSPKEVATREHTWAFLHRAYVLVTNKKIDKIPTFNESVSFIKAKGISDGSNPKSGLKRKQLWAMIFRLNEVIRTNGVFNLNSKHPSGKKWSEVSNIWAVDNKITDGGNPESIVSREEALNMIYNYVQFKQGEN